MDKNKVTETPFGSSNNFSGFENRLKTKVSKLNPSDEILDLLDGQDPPPPDRISSIILSKLLPEDENENE